jgi:hypothetical protein
LEYRQGARHGLKQLRTAIDNVFERRPELKTNRPETGFAHADEFREWAVGETYKRRKSVFETSTGGVLDDKGAGNANKKITS